MLIPIPWVHAGLGSLLALVSLALMTRQVPMNRGIGFRLPQAMASHESWYAINAYGGKWLFAESLLLLIFSAATWESAPPPNSALAPICLLLPLVGLLIVIVMVKRFAARL